MPEDVIIIPPDSGGTLGDVVRLPEPAGDALGPGSFREPGSETVTFPAGGTFDPSNVSPIAAPGGPVASGVPLPPTAPAPEPAPPAPKPSPGSDAVATGRARAVGLGGRLVLGALPRCDELTGLDRIKCLLLGAAVLFVGPKVPFKFPFPVKPRVKPRPIPRRAPPVPKRTLPTIKPAPKKPGPFRRDKPFVRPKKPAKPAPPPKLPPRVPLRPGPLLPNVSPIQPGPGESLAPKPAPVVIPRPDLLADPGAAGRTVADAVSRARTSPTLGRAPASQRSASTVQITGPGLLTTALTGLGIGSIFSRLAGSSPAATAVQAQLGAATGAPPVAVGVLPAPIIAGARPPTRTGAQRQCVEVKRRRRRRGKCREGFFEELPSRTRFITWRTVDCRTRKTVRESK